MNEQKSNASDKSVYTPILSESSSDSNKSDKPDEKVDKKPPQLDWRKVLRNMRDVSSIASVLISLYNILQELGLLP